MTTTRVHYRDEAGVDCGYLGDAQNWWFNPSLPHSFEVFDLDSFYEDVYFQEDHVDTRTVHAYVDSILDYGQRLRGAPVQSVLELGCAGGWFTQEFLARGLDVLAVEGSRAGYERTLGRGIPKANLLRHDLRRPLQLSRRFDAAVCTEVAEHIECPFSSQLVLNLVTHADVIWFSFEPPDTNEAHYHHSNEQPAKFWLNLFAYYDYRPIELPAAVHDLVGQRGTHVFCGPNVHIPSDLHELHVASNPTPGAGRARSRDAKYWIQQVVPPIALSAALALKRKAGAALKPARTGA